MTCNCEVTIKVALREEHSPASGDYSTMCGCVPDGLAVSSLSINITYYCIDCIVVNKNVVFLTMPNCIVI